MAFIWEMIDWALGYYTGLFEHLAMFSLDPCVTTVDGTGLTVVASIHGELLASLKLCQVLRFVLTIAQDEDTMH